jgi:hypothetical protein
MPLDYPELFSRAEMKTMILERILEVIEIVPNGKTAEEMEETVDAFVDSLEKPCNPLDLLSGVPKSNRINLRKCYAIAYRDLVVVEAILSNKKLLDNFTLSKIATSCLEWSEFFSLNETGENRQRAQLAADGWADVLRQIDYPKQKEAS